MHTSYIYLIYYLFLSSQIYGDHILFPLRDEETETKKD